MIYLRIACRDEPPRSFKALIAGRQAKESKEGSRHKEGNQAKNKEAKENKETISKKGLGQAQKGQVVQEDIS
jgi:hypothetical protein